MRNDIDVHPRVSDMMCRFYRWIRRRWFASGIDLNVFASTDLMSSGGIGQTSSSAISEVFSPFELGYTWSVDHGNNETDLDIIYSVPGDEVYVIYTI